MRLAHVINRARDELRPIALRLRHEALRRRPSRVFAGAWGLRWRVEQANALDWDLVGNRGVSQPEIPAVIGLATSRAMAVDVGANAGYWTLPLAASFARTLAIEPNPAMVTKLKRNLALNPGLERRVRIVAGAASGSRGELRLHLRGIIGDDARYNTGMGSTVARDLVRRTLVVPATTVDDECLGHAGPVGLIKIDVEGAEASVLTGARGILARDAPVVLWEANLTLDRQLDRDNVEASLRLLDGAGYRHWGLYRPAGAVEIGGYAGLAERGVDVDVLSLPGGRSGEEVADALARARDWLSAPRATPSWL